MQGPAEPVTREAPQLLAALGLPGVSSRPPDLVAFSDGVYAEFARPKRVVG